MTRTPAGNYAMRAYFSVTKQLICYVEYSDKRRKICDGLDWEWYDSGELRFEGQNVAGNSEGLDRN